MAGRTFTILLTLGYPVAVFLALKFWNLQGLGALAVLAGVARLAVGERPRTVLVWTSGIALICIGVLLLWTRLDGIARVYPIVVNATMLAWFGWSLLHPPTVVERIARIADPNLPAYAVTYTRYVTFAWLLFFAVNGAIATYTAVYSSLEFWTYYNGAIAYVLMGCLFGVEFVLRRFVRARHEAGVG